MFLALCNGLFPLPETDSNPDSDSDSCTMQDFSTHSDSDSNPLIKMYGIGMEICPWDGDLSLGWRSVPKMGTVSIWETIHTGIRIQIGTSGKSCT